MKKLSVLVTLVLSLGIVLAFTRPGTHLKGYIDDSICAASKTPMCTPETRVKCANKCIAGGASAVLVAGDKVYKIANQSAASKYAGKNVEVDGEVTGDSVQITKIMEAK